ncbi:hypothetical protein ACFQU1_15850 [Chelatococcus sp. GCM10030263]|uniref:hypothetical protein n=1 Tax=Chelatococcus sp. GCM10030263 TaxID=3273387 RepID=UPI00361A8F40
MIGLISRLAATALAPARFAARRALVEAALMAAAILLIVIAAVFAIIALTCWLSLQVGLVNASLIMCGLFIVAAGVVLLVRASSARRRRLRGRSVPPPGLSAAGSVPGAGFRPEDLAMMATRDLVKGLSPFQLALAAAVAGFIGGRMLDRK